MPTKEDAIISSWMAEHGHSELAWEPDTPLICENGHFTEASTWHQSVGEPCTKGLGNGGKTLQHVLFDFTQPVPLLAAVKVFCDETGNGWRWQRFMDPSDGYHGEIYGAPPHAWMRGGETPEAALRAALSDAIESEKGS